jgi:hypothetical protein
MNINAISKEFSTAGVLPLSGEVRWGRPWEADVAYYATERKTYLDLLKKYHLEDTTANASQNLIQLLSCESDLESRYEMVFAQIANNEYTAANTTLDNMESILPENDLEIIKYYKMRNILPIIEQLNSGETTWENIDQSIVNELSENDDELPGMLAKSIRLRFDTAFIYEEPIYTDLNEELRLSIPKNNNKLTVKSNNESFKVSPNPANEFLIVEYSVEKSAKEILLVITDMQGRLIRKQQLTNTTNQTLINVEALLNGNYHFTIMVDGQQKSIKKIIIQH